VTVRRFVPACQVEDIRNGRHLAVEVEGRPILILNVNRVFHAVSNRCTHLDYPLDGGRQMGCEIFCRKHGARFDVRNGKALSGPAVDRLKIYETRVIDGVVEVALDDPA
jgi:3-phenylpropionate/trans-cinnamate dioxygenase ferredoxin component